ncbi:cyclopentanol dehydrogenase [Virgibacillus halotolerans]|uniref:SDR family NAD(P)-dependent oxidoreductase n=1 Tax=Virgibacillus halotolerans TaxID=1071053 RepID=UPI00195FDBB4|nr:glucose 1-dehydrogenase [Virgibacillus halotolerans]MBM7598998.1 cyclopentanol dehydrogenase [Virgibacillus halotolerans]
MERLKDKVAIITGAANGQGAAEAKMFSENGAKVVMTDILEEELQNVANNIRGDKKSVLSLKHDVTSEKDWKHIINETKEHFGKIDILVNNAGIGSTKTIEEETIEGWEKVQKVNSNSVFIGIKYTAPEMKKSGGGSIINLSSVYGIIGVKGYSAYHASKGAIRSLSKTAAMEFAKHHIRVNSVHPGLIQTPMTESLFLDPNIVEWMQSVTPWPRLGKPEDVANGVLFLASDESSFITGTELIIDGGWTTH